MAHTASLNNPHHRSSVRGCGAQTRSFVFGSMVMVLAAAASGQTVSVDSADDIVDIPWNGTLADLPGPNGKTSLREATIAADNTAGPQTVAFAIPQSLWHPFYPNRATIELDGPISLNNHDTTIDFSTQTAFTGDTNPNGNEVGLVYFGPPSGFSFIYVFGDRNVVSGWIRPAATRSARRSRSPTTTTG